MEAKRVYEAQQALQQAERALEDLARQEALAQRAGAWISSGDYLRGPEGRAVTALRTEVEAMQTEVGGVVYRIPIENLPGLVEKLEKLQKRAAKRDLGKLRFRVTNEREQHDVKLDPLVALAELGYVPKSQSFGFLVLDAEPLKLADWMLLATLTVESGGVMISKVPAYARAWALNREGRGAAPGLTDDRNDEVVSAAQAALDALDLGGYRDEAKATHCDHCGKARRRTKTYLVEHATSGEVKQVGSNCLRDFLGTDPARITAYATYLSELDGAMGEGEGGGVGGKRETLALTYLTHVCTMLRTKGWASRSSGGPATADAAWSNLGNYGKSEKGFPLFTAVEPEDEARAQAAIEWGRTTLAETARGDFDHNLVVAARGELVPRKGDGVLAYLPVAHAKFLEREVERAERNKRDAEIGASSEWVGREKERIVVTGTVLSVYEKPGDWGTTFITKIAGDDGNIYKWFGSYDLGRGNKITGRFTVKKHDEFKGVKETVIARPSGLTEIRDERGDEIEADASRFVACDGSHSSRGGHVYFPEGDPAGTFEIVGYARGSTAVLRPVLVTA